MKCYASPYEGDQDYIFFSYCHEDAATVYPIIERLEIEGFRVWYDDGIHPGEDWPEVIAQHLNHTKTFLAAVSKASAESHNCRNEVNFAVANNKPFLSVIVEEFLMPLGMKLQLSSSRFLNLYEHTEDSFYNSLLSAPTLTDCRMPESQADSTALELWKQHKAEYDLMKKTAKPLPGAENVARQWFNDEVRNVIAARRDIYKGMPEKDLPEEENDGISETVPDKNLGIHIDDQGRFGEALLKTKEDQDYLEEARPRAQTEVPNRIEFEQSDGIGGTHRELKAAQIDYSGLMKSNAEDDSDKTVLLQRYTEENPEDPTVTNIAYNPALIIRIKTGEVFFVKNEQTVIGRTKSKADLVISENKAISGKHVAILKKGNKYSLCNLKPTNETVVDGRELEPEECVDLNPSSEIFLADEQFFLVFGAAYDRVFDEQKLCLLLCKETGETKLLAEDRFPLDRNHQWRNRVLGDTRISRSGHAEICCEHGRMVLRDLGSKNGTFLDGVRLPPNESLDLRDGDTIAIVDTEFIYHELRIGA